MGGNSFLTLGACLSRLSFVLGAEHCSEVDDLRCLGAFDRWSTLAKWCCRYVASSRYRVNSLNVMSTGSVLQ